MSLHVLQGFLNNNTDTVYAYVQLSNDKSIIWGCTQGVYCEFRIIICEKFSCTYKLEIICATISE